MKRLLILFGLVILVRHEIQGQGLKFHEDLNFAQLKSKAKSEKKYIFLDVMATWCGPCRAMEQTTYGDTALGKYFGEKFLSVKIQTDKMAKDDAFVKSWYLDAGYIQNAYQVTGLPSLIFLSPDGELLYKSVGYRSAEELIADAKKAMDPSIRFDLLLKQYADGNKDKVFLNKLIKVLDSLGRKIMAQKITFEDLHLMENGTAYTTLQQLINLKLNRLQADYSGVWKINYPACEFGDKPLGVASKRIEVTQNNGNISLSRLAVKDNAEEYSVNEILQSGRKITVTATVTENRKKYSRYFVAADGKDFTTFSEYTFPNSEKEIDYVVTERWALINPDELHVERTINTNAGSYTVKLVYNKN